MKKNEATAVRPESKKRKVAKQRIKRSLSKPG